MNAAPLPLSTSIAARMAREELDDPAAWLLTADVAATIGACRVARMAVRSTAGPLVTAQLFRTPFSSRRKS